MSAELVRGSERVTVRVDGEQVYHYFKRSGCQVEVVIE